MPFYLALIFRISALADASAEAPLGAVVLYEGAFYEKQLQTDLPSWVPKKPWGYRVPVEYESDNYLLLEKTYQKQKGHR